MAATDLLDIHPSFWKHRGFSAWQILRRKKEYCSAEIFCSRDAAVFRDSFYSRYYRDYPRPKPNQEYAHWACRISTHGPRAVVGSGGEREIILSSDFLPEELRLPDHWPPVPPEIDFPHPNALDRLTPSTIGVAVTSIAFHGMVKIRIAGRHFWVDLGFSMKEIVHEIFIYLGLEGARQWSGARESLSKDQYKRRREIETEVTKQLRPSLQHKKQKTLKLPYALAAYEMGEANINHRQIAIILWPKDVQRFEKERRRFREARARGTLIDRAKEHVKYAKRLIASAFVDRRRS
jgi:hypothetical protein